MEIFNIKNEFGFELEDLFYIGKRVNNSKRNFLFISKLLGKHIPVNPDVCKVTGHLLTSLCYEGLDQDTLVKYLKGYDVKVNLYDCVEPSGNVLVVGFAETATGLGMSVASAIKGCVYYSTTRESFADKDFLFSFEEEHSHATTHKCYDILRTDFSDVSEIVLVDDEITTGNSMLNLIRQLHKLSGVSKYKVLSILDWRGDFYKSKYVEVEKELGVSIEVFSILSGEINNDDSTVFEVDEGSIPCIEGSSTTNLVNGIFKRTFSEGKVYYRYSGRFGVFYDDIQNLEEDALISAMELKEYLDSQDFNGRILILSEGENIYIPSRIASYLNKCYDVEFKSTTRSPIYCDGEIIKDRYKYEGMSGVEYNLYNKSEVESEYDLVLYIQEIPTGVKITSNSVSVCL